jgi:hypothetical protein
MINNRCWYYTIDANVAGLSILNHDKNFGQNHWQSIGLIIESLR